MSRVVGIRLTAVAVPYRPELGAVVTAGLRLTEARHLLVEVHTDDGRVGLGEAVPRPSVYGETLDGMRAVIEDLLAPGVLDSDPFDVERVWAGWERVVGNQSAKASLDVALHDLAARSAGVPLYRMLGGWSDGTIPLTMALAMGRPQDLAVGAAEAVEAGYRTVKLKVGSSVDDDLAVVAAVRAAVGPDVALYADANGGYSRRDALRAGRAFERHELVLFEEPIAAWDTSGRAKLASAIDIPLLLDESTNDAPAVIRELTAGTAGAISIRAARSGVTVTRHLIGLAVLANVPCLTGSHRELGVGVAANAHLAAAFRSMAFPAELGSHVHLEDGLLETPLVINDGSLRLPAGPGLGVTLDRERVARYRLWSTDIGELPA
jgi:L-alanine-DL-glutamate epimerase-like enolase superfamily enzyme